MADSQVGTPINPRPLIVVDVQVGFLNEFTAHIPDRIATLIESARFDPVLFTRFINTPDSPYRRVLDWHECGDPPATDLATAIAPHAGPERIFSKSGQTGLPEALADFLQTIGADEVHVVGLDTDMCVLKVALDLFDRRFTPVLLTDCCASTAGLQAHLAGLAILCRNIGARHLRDGGLGGGSLGAPER